MDFDFIDLRGWKYHFSIDEDSLTYIDFIVEMGKNGTCKSAIAFSDDVFSWRTLLQGQIPIFSPEAKEFCEKKVKSFMKMKVFW